jgi:O-antigen ligase
LRATGWVIVALLSLTPLIVLPDAKESFRLGQGLLAGWLGLLSLVIASWTLRSVGAVTLSDLWARPAIRALLPLSIVVAAGGLVTRHPAHFHAAVADFLIGVACLAGWSLALDDGLLRRLLVWTLPVAAIVALLGLDQMGGLFGTLDWLHVDAPTARLRMTSTIGNPGDLAALLVLPTLVALDRWRRASSRERVALCIAIPLFVGTIAVTATLAAGIAVVAGAIVWWWRSSPGPRHLRTPLLAALAIVLLVGGGVAAIPQLRTRVIEKSIELSQGDINALLTGRLDGWRAAWAMLWQSPATGVGQGGFRAEYADTRVALEARGVPFFGGQLSVILATPHNEALSVGAEQGLPGLVALGWAIWTLWQGARRLNDQRLNEQRVNERRLTEQRPPDRGQHDPDSRGLAWAGLTALTVLCVVSFPLHVPSVAWPWLLFLAWLFRRSDAGEAAS